MLAVIRLAIYLSPEPYRSRFYSLMLRSSFLSRHAKVVCNARVDCACGIGVAHGRLTCGASLPSYPSACRPSPCRLGRAGEPPSGLAPRPGSRPKVSFHRFGAKKIFCPCAERPPLWTPRGPPGKGRSDGLTCPIDTSLFCIPGLQGVGTACSTSRAEAPAAERPAAAGASCPPYC